jgi:hypothetical protein
MQIVSLWSIVIVDEEQGIRNDGSKSSRSHRALEHSGLVFLAAKKARQERPLSTISNYFLLKHMCL